ncbi:TonB-dependent receptor [Stutzerimonas nosocomialis]|uniref:TonB-dependent receptor n=2 Tax=Stutzerimonas nosocomialis TaxID=1056496 RepID=A0A5R9QBH4_9GAMM|nr:TonB-dependent receptor [Stutzerimonas nosocomialis]
MPDTTLPGRAARAPLCAMPYVLASMTLLCWQARAETREAADSTLTLGTVTVSATASGPLPSTRVLSSVDVLGADILEKQPVTYSWELFNRAPGVMLTPFGQGTTSGKLSMRGFNGEGEINAVKLLIDGIPSNSNDGNMPYLDMVFPLELERIEVVRGTNDARYGLHNIAGNANLVTRSGGDYGRARVRYGSYGLREGQVAKGIEGSNWSQNYFVGYQQSDGYRDHADSDRYVLSGKWFFTPDQGDYRIGLIARHYEAQAEEPGYLSREDARRHPRRSYGLSASDEGERSMSQVSLHLDAALSDALDLSAKAYLNRYDDDRWVRFSLAQSQQQRTTDETGLGALTSLTYRPGLDWLTLEGGLDVERQRNSSKRYLTVSQVKQSQTRDQRFDFDIYGAYAQAVIEPLPALKIIPAYRVDHIEGELRDGLTGNDYDVNDYGLIRQPKISLVYAPWREASLYANWGRTFQVGTGASAYKVPPRSADLSPSINDGWETGIKFQPSDWLDGRIAYWEQVASDEVRRRLNDPSGDSENLGKTRRWGYDAQLNLHPRGDASLWLAYSRQYSRIEKPDPSLPTSRGKQIDHVPAHLYSAGASWDATPRLQLSGWLNGQSDYYLERENDQGRYGGFTLVNLGATYRVSERVELDLQLKNLADRYYEYVWHDGAQSLHAPGERRSLYAGVTMEF